MSRNSETGALIAGLVWLTIVGFAIYGWAMNLKHVINYAGPLVVGEIIRIVGIFMPPLGAIMGLFF